MAMLRSYLHSPCEAQWYLTGRCTKTRQQGAPSQHEQPAGDSHFPVKSCLSDHVLHSTIATGCDLLGEYYHAQVVREQVLHVLQRVPRC